MYLCASAHRWLAHRLIVVRRQAAQIGRAGAVAIVTAVCAPILLMIVGFVIDFSYASYINQRLARATDAATLGAVSQTAATAGGGYGNLTFLQSRGVNLFNANTTQLGVSGVNFSLSVLSDGAGGVTAAGSYTLNVPTFFAGVLGFNNIPVSGSATTTAHPLVYVSYYILVDASQSMGIASTAADMARLYNLVLNYPNPSDGEAGCVFACHVKAPGQTVTNEFIAHNASPPIQLRIDAAVAAIKSIISQAQAIAGANRNIQFALYTIQKDPASLTTLHPVATLSTDYTALQTAASTIDLGNNNSNGRGDTDFATEFAEFNTILTASGITTNGVGTTATSPLNYYFIITDGLTDTYSSSCGSTHCTGALDSSLCAQLSQKGTVGVIYTTYSPIWANNNPSGGVLENNYKNLVAPFSSQIKPALQSCATSSDYFFEASDGPALVAATQALFQRTQATSARITQ